MKFSINKTELQNAISIVLKGVSTHSTLPILSGILIEAENEQITLQTTDLELSIKYSVAALVEEEGKTVFPGKLFSDIVKNLPEAAIHIAASQDNASITCDTSSFSLKVLSSEDFPGFPRVDVSQCIEIPFTQFSTMVRRVARIVSKDESRAILTGVLISFEDNVLKMVATDSYRLGVTETSLVTDSVESFQAVISGSFLFDIASLPKAETPISLALAENQIVVTCENIIYVNRRIEGNFPNYQQLLPENYATRAKIDINRLVSAVKRTSLLGATNSPIRFNLNIDSQTIQLSAITQDIGSAQEIIPCEITGEDMEIAFNYSYVLEGLPAVSTDEVYLEVLSPMKPGIFRAGEEENYLYLVMPVRVA